MDLPFDALMVKCNGLHEALARQLELAGAGRDDISKYLATTIRLDALGIDYDKPANPSGSCRYEGRHDLMAFHLSSKDIPNWVWTGFEHVDLPGRCDVTGCNDAYGYRSGDTLPEGVADSVVFPHPKTDGLNLPSHVFSIGQIGGYARESICDGLRGVFKTLGISTAQSSPAAEPDPQDAA